MIIKEVVKLVDKHIIKKVKEGLGEWLQNRDFTYSTTSNNIWGSEIKQCYQIRNKQGKIEYKCDSYKLEKWAMEVKLYTTQSNSLDAPEIIISTNLSKIKRLIKSYEAKKLYLAPKHCLIYQLEDWRIITQEATELKYEGDGSIKAYLIKYAKVLPIHPPVELTKEEWAKYQKDQDLAKKEIQRIEDKLNAQEDIEVIKNIRSISIGQCTPEEQRQFQEILYKNGNNLNILIDSDSYNYFYIKGILDTIKWLRSPDFYVNLRIAEGYIVDDGDIREFLKEKNIDDKNT